MTTTNAIMTAVTGLKAQAKALENISGNIANSQTAGYKKVDTTFSDLIADAGVKNVRSGAVAALGRSSTALRGDVTRADSETSLSIAGQGFFPVIDTQGRMLYTRRGDFGLTLDPQTGERYLVNGAGYRLVDARYSPSDAGGLQAKSNLTIPNAPMEPKKTTSFEYRLNLPQIPKTSSYDPKVPNSELLGLAGLSTRIPEEAIVSLLYGQAGSALARDSIDPGDNVTVTLDGRSRSYVFDTGELPTPTVTAPAIRLDASGTNDEMIARIVADLRSNLPGAETSEAYLDASQNLIIKMNGSAATTLSITSDLAGVSVTLPSTATKFSVLGISGSDADRFMSQSIAGGSLTAYGSAGETIPVQMRWAKTQSTPSEQWSLFYQSNSAATGTQTAWEKVGDYSFSGGQLTAMRAASGTAQPTGEIVIPNLTVNDTSLGSLRIAHGASGVTQYADASGLPATSRAQQDGYAKGAFDSVTVDDQGHILASYSNGRTQVLGSVRLAVFRAADNLQRVDGEAFEATQASGGPKLSTSTIMAGWIENSNVDIADEFANLIVTQQAYSANSRVVSTSNEMEKEALNAMR